MKNEKTIFLEIFKISYLDTRTGNKRCIHISMVASIKTKLIGTKMQTYTQ